MSLKPAPAPAQADHPELFPTGTERRELDNKGYLVQREAVDSTKIRKANQAEHRFLTHALPRMELLMSKMDSGPLGQASWHQRAMAVLEIKSRVAGLRAARMPEAAAEMEMRFLFEMMELLEASNATFGDWQADPGTRVSVAVT